MKLLTKDVLRYLRNMAELSTVLNGSPHQCSVLGCVSVYIINLGTLFSYC